MIVTIPELRALIRESIRAIIVESEFKSRPGDTPSANTHDIRAASDSKKRWNGWTKAYPVVGEGEEEDLDEHEHYDADPSSGDKNVAAAISGIYEDDDADDDEMEEASSPSAAVRGAVSGKTAGNSGERVTSGTYN